MIRNSEKNGNGPFWFLFFVLVVAYLLYQLVAPVHRQKTDTTGNVLVQYEGVELVGVPTNVNKDGKYTVYAEYHFGPDEEYLDVLSAALALFAVVGNREVYIYCGQDSYTAYLEHFMNEYQKETVLGMPKEKFCPMDGYIEVH